MAPILALFLFLAADPFAGTWKANLAKSKLPPPVPAGVTTTIRIDGNAVDIIENVEYPGGRSDHVTVSAHFDGKYYPVKGSPFADEVAYTRPDTRTIKGTGRKHGKVVSHETVILARDGKSLTATFTGTSLDGKPVSGMMVAERQ